MKTKSKHFKDHEIKGILPNGTIYLKEGIKRKHYNDNVDPDSLESHLNQELINYQKHIEFMKYTMSLDDFEDN